MPYKIGLHVLRDKHSVSAVIIRHKADHLPWSEEAYTQQWLAPSSPSVPKSGELSNGASSMEKLEVFQSSQSKKR